MNAIDPRRVEEAALNALQSQRQLFYDGWLLRLSPGKARRARSVNAHFGSSLPLGDKIAYCERVYRAHGLPLLFRMTPFAQPRSLEGALAEREYEAFDETLVQAVALDRPPEAAGDDDDMQIASASPADWVAAVGALRGSTAEQRAAHLERIAHSPLETRLYIATIAGLPVATGQFTREDDLAGLFDIVTGEAWRNRNVATRLCARLLVRAWERGARVAYLQVDAGNAAALAIYRKFGFATLYTYHYRAPAGSER